MKADLPTPDNQGYKVSKPQTEIVKSEDIMERPITFRPFMGSEDIVLTANSVLKLIAKPTRSGKMPTPAQAIRFAKLCEARGLNPWEGDAFLVGYDSQDGAEFNLITAHQAFLKRAEVHPEFDGMESGVVVENDNGELSDQPGDFVAKGQTLVGGWARVHFKTRKISTYRRINLSTFITGRSRWQKDPGGMIVKCAEADALRSSFPTKLGGLYLSEEFDAVGETTKIRAAIPMPHALPMPIPADAPAEPEQPAPPPPEPEAQPDPVPAESQEPTQADREAADVAAMGAEWPKALGYIRDNTGPDVTDEEFNGGIGKWALALRKKGKEGTIPTAQRLVLLDAVRRGAFDFQTGTVGGGGAV